jgi:hypothetical protein
VTDIHDLVRAVVAVAERWAAGRYDWAESWDVMEDDPATVGHVVAAFRSRLGLPPARLMCPAWMLSLAAAAGDLLSWFGWSPPVRSTALVEMARGVRGDPGAFNAASGVVPKRLTQVLELLPATVQEKWFSRLYLLKLLALVMLSVFWCASGLIALFVSFAPAVSILTGHRMPQGLANGVTLVSSCVDIAVGVLIAFRRTCAVGLWAGIAISLGYMVGAAILTPDMWIEPLGALVKTGPAIVLMGLALAMLEER